MILVIEVFFPSDFLLFYLLRSSHIIKFGIALYSDILTYLILAPHHSIIISLSYKP